MHDHDGAGGDYCSCPIVLGIDPSLTGCGWALLESSHSHPNKVLGMGVIKSKKRGWERIDDIMTGLGKNLPIRPNMMREGPNFYVAIEGYSFGAQGNALYQLAELGGILRYHFWCNNVRYEDWPAMTWRKVIFGKGNFRKPDEKDAFKERFGLEGDLNALEAWAIARSSLLYHYETNWTPAQTEVFKKRKEEESLG